MTCLQADESHEYEVFIFPLKNNKINIRTLSATNLISAKRVNLKTFFLITCTITPQANYFYEVV